MAKVKDHSYLKWVICGSRNFKANMFVRFQMIAVAQFMMVIALSGVQFGLKRNA